jgi:hypothetical protein
VDVAGKRDGPSEEGRHDETLADPSLPPEEYSRAAAKMRAATRAGVEVMETIIARLPEAA